VKIKLYEIGNKNNNPKPKLLTLPFSLQTLLGIECIPFESVKVELLHQRSQLISKRDGVPYLQKHIWNRISANGTWQQFVPLAPNQFGFESILIIGDMIFVFQMKYKSQFEKKLGNSIPEKWVKDMKTIVPILTEKMGFEKKNIRFVFLTNAVSFSMAESYIDGIQIIKINKQGLDHITNLNIANQNPEVNDVVKKN